MRIHKALSGNGIASRRKAEQLIEEGRVTINGHKASLGQDVNIARDVIHIDGERIMFEKKAKKFYVMLNKPRGYVTTLSDELGRRCVAELVSEIPTRVYPIGRLDKDSEGLLLLTNDGDFANFIMHPSHHVSKTYRVTVRPEITEDQLITLSTGVTLDDGSTTQPAQVQIEVKEPGRVVLRMTIYEGKNRQIRRMCEAVGLEVARLRRISIGPLKLGMLEPGKWRELTTVEVGALRGAITIVNPRSAEPPKPKGDYRRGAKPYGDKPAYKSYGDKPAAKSYGDKPAAKPYGDKPAAKPYGDKPAAKPYGDKPAAKPYGDKPAAKPYGDKPAAKPYGDKPAAKPYGDKPAAKPYGDKPAAKSYGNKPVAKPFDKSGAKPFDKSGAKPFNKPGSKPPKRG